MKKIYFQYGCGFSAPADWMNFDASPTLRFERIPLIGRLWTKNAKRFPENVRYGNIVKGLPLPLSSCDGAYCSHILEHLALRDVDVALLNTFHYLRPGATFRLVVPDLENLARRYLANSSTTASHDFMRATRLGKEMRPSGFKAFMEEWLGNHWHLWMWDEKSITEALRKTGFGKIRRCGFNDAADPKFKDVEHERRFAGCLAVECIKP